MAACNYLIRPGYQTKPPSRCTKPADHRLVAVDNGIVHMEGCKTHCEKMAARYDGPMRVESNDRRES